MVNLHGPEISNVSDTLSKEIREAIGKVICRPSGRASGRSHQLDRWDGRRRRECGESGHWGFDGRRARELGMVSASADFEQINEG
jgi:hypothetical protein